MQIFTKFAVWAFIFTFHAGDMNCSSTDGATAINFCLILLTKHLDVVVSEFYVIVISLKVEDAFLHNNEFNLPQMFIGGLQNF